MNKKLLLLIPALALFQATFTAERAYLGLGLPRRSVEKDRRDQRDDARKALLKRKVASKLSKRTSSFHLVQQPNNRSRKCGR